METKRNLLAYLNLQLFSENGAGDVGTSAEGTTGETAVAAVPQTKAVKKNPLEDVKYGIQEDKAQVADAQKAEAEEKPAEKIDRNAEFEKLIKGEYKDLYDAKMQETIKLRLKGTKEAVEKYEAIAPTLEMLAKKYGVEATDIKAISKAIEEDDAFYEEEASEMGITVPQLKAMRKTERENALLKRQMEENKAKQNAAKIYSNWINQGEQLKSIYPSFNLETELQNPKFADLLRVPTIDVRTAYEVIHKDEIIPAAMQHTAQVVERKLTNKIIANGARPNENGNSSQSASLTKSDVSLLTKADRQEIARRARQGEKIRF